MSNERARVKIEIRKVDTRQFVGVRRTIKQEEIGRLCAEVLPRMMKWIADKGAVCDGPPSTVYHSVDRETGTYDLQPGFFVSAPVDVEADITSFETANGEVLAATHVGPYETIGDTWHALFARAEELGRKVTKASWEIYADDPGEVDAASLRTQIFVPVD